MKEQTSKKLLSVISTIFRVISVLAVIAVAFEIVLYFIGFRFVYPAEFSNDWNAISAVAAWVSAGGTLVAVWAAVQIPKKIAEQQNKINLLNFRSEVRETVIEVSDRIRAFSNFLIFNINSIEKLKTSDTFAFFDLPQYYNNQRIIDKYKFYFQDYRNCANKFLKLYYNIAWAYLKFKLENKKYGSLEDLMKAVKQANDYVNSEEFAKLKKYMENALTLSE